MSAAVAYLLCRCGTGAAATQHGPWGSVCEPCLNSALGTRYRSRAQTAEVDEAAREAAKEAARKDWEAWKVQVNFTVATASGLVEKWWKDKASIVKNIEPLSPALRAECWILWRQKEADEAAKEIERVKSVAAEQDARANIAAAAFAQCKRDETKLKAEYKAAALVEAHEALDLARAQCRMLQEQEAKLRNDPNSLTRMMVDVEKLRSEAAAVKAENERQLALIKSGQHRKQGAVDPNRGR